MPSERAEAGPSEPDAVVRRFLALMEARDLDAASALLAPDVEMVFPGDVRFDRLEALVAWSRDRYARVAKRFDRVDTMPADHSAVVVVQGTLYGAWPDGSAFDGIRFIDWFELKDGLIRRQHVWNDLAEMARRRPIDSA